MITEKLAHFIAEVEPSDIPKQALTVARSAITDYVSVTLAGSKEETGKIIADFARAMGGKEESSVIGGSFKTSSYLASLANGTTGHALDYDDGGGFGHCSVVLAPAVLAIGEGSGASGKDILTAYIVGFEAVSSFHGTVGPAHYARGWHSTATTGTIAATAAVAWLIDLNPQQVRMALGIAGSLIGGLRQNFGTMTKPLHAGNAASNGVKAAVLAKMGFTADENIIEAPGGFARVLGYDSEVDWVKASNELGKSFTIIRQGRSALHFKLYPSCGSTHTSIDAALALYAEHHPNVDDIIEIKLGVSPAEKISLIHHRPRTGLEGKFSLEYTVARALLSGEVGIKHFTDMSVNESPVKKLIEKMQWDEKYPAAKPGSRKTFGPNSITLKLKDGKIFYHDVLSPKGSPQNPVGPSELQSKYRDCALMVLSQADTEKSWNILSNFENLSNIKELMEIVKN